MVYREQSYALLYNPISPLFRPMVKKIRMKAKIMSFTRGHHIFFWANKILRDLLTDLHVFAPSGISFAIDGKGRYIGLWRRVYHPLLSSIYRHLSIGYK